MQRIAVFDFDGTIIHGDSVVAMLFYARKKGLAGFRHVLNAALAGAMYHLHLIGPMPSKRAAHAFLKKLPDDAREAFLRDFAQTLFDRARPEALQQIRKHQENGEHVILCSASGDCYMQYVAPLLQVNALLCTPCDENGLPCGTNCRGEEKVRRVSEYLSEHDLQNAMLTAGYGDTAGDAPMLALCGHKVAVNPRKKLMKELANADGVTAVRWKCTKEASR